MKQIVKMLLLAAMLFPLGCTAETTEGKPSGKSALVGTEWIYHYEGNDTIMDQVFTNVGDYTLQFLTDSTGLYLVDTYVIINGVSQNSNNQMGIKYTFDGHSGVIKYIFPEGTPSYVRASMPPQKFVHDAKKQELIWVNLLDPTWEKKHGKMIFRPKK